VSDQPVIDLPPYRTLAYELPAAEAGPLMQREMERTARALHAIGEPFSPEGRVRWVALWRAWLDGAAAVFQGEEQWNQVAAEVYQILDQLMDYAEGRDVPPRIDKLFGGSGNA